MPSKKMIVGILSTAAVVVAILVVYTRNLFGSGFGDLIDGGPSGS